MSPTISVVIASLGGESLLRVIDCLKEQTIKLTEIIVVVPVTEDTVIKSNLTELKRRSVLVIQTQEKGQVSQRSVGLSQASGSIIIQLDDDVEFNKGTIKELVDAHIYLGPDSVIGPALYSTKTRQYIFHRSSFLSELVHRFLSGHRPEQRSGKLTDFGIGYGVDLPLVVGPYTPVEWLPGAAVLCSKSTLVKDNYFPFPGRAYSEDLIHSFLWRQRGGKMYFCARTRMFMDHDADNFDWAAITGELKAKMCLVRLMQGSQVKLFIWLACKSIDLIVKGIVSWTR